MFVELIWGSIISARLFKKCDIMVFVVVCGERNLAHLINNICFIIFFSIKLSSLARFY